LVLRTDRDWLLDIVRFVVARRRMRTGMAIPQTPHSQKVRL
jgi:hypothetical protein